MKAKKLLSGLTSLALSLSAFAGLGVTDSLTVNDPRRAIQLPQDVITAGLEGNPRTK